MQYTNLIWRDGQPYSELFDDIYYSVDESEDISGEGEFQHVFFKNNGLPERWQGRDEFVIAELGFGSGLNCILTIREWLKHCAECNDDKTLHYIAIEKYPLSPDSIAALVSRYPDLKSYCDEMLESYPPAIEASHSRRLFDNRVVVHFKFMDVAEALSNDHFNVDAWFLDGFSPAKNPDMWSSELFAMITNNSRAGATCSTYTSAGFVKRNMQSAGFVVSKVNGHGKKRDMLIAELADAKLNNTKPLSFNYEDKPWFESPQVDRTTTKDAMIIGAGIAGLSLAYSLVQRGWTVSIIDRHGGNQKEATSNPAPIVYPRLSVDNDVDTEFYIAAYCYALHVYESLQKKSQLKFWFDDGLFQLVDRKRITRIIKKFNFSSDLISQTDELSDNDVSGIDEESTVVKFVSAGVVLPAILCEVLKDECGDSLKIIKSEVRKIKYGNNKWQCFDDSRLIKDAEVLIVASGADVNVSGLPTNYPVETIRGQVMVLKENQSSGKIKKTLNADVHITPAINGKHYLGATYARNCANMKVCETDNRKLLTSLNNIYPDVFRADDHCDTWIGFRAMSKDRVPVVGAVPDEAFFDAEYADIRHGNTAREYLPASYLNGLYISAAHGSRGFTSSFISAEIIASQIAGEPSPVNKKILDYLNPSRFIVNDLKRR